MRFYREFARDFIVEFKAAIVILMLAIALASLGVELYPSHAHAQGQSSILQSDTFTTATTGSIVNVTNNPVTTFGVQLKGTGAAATTATCVLEGSLNGANYTTILTFGADGVMVWQAAGVLNPVAFFRINCSVITLGPATNVVAKVLAIS